MTKREAAIVSAYTGILIGDFRNMHKYIEEILCRPVYTDELGMPDIWDEIKQKSYIDLVKIEIE